MYDIDHPMHLLNKPNSSGLTPLYVASLHGHIDVKYIYI